MNSVHSHVATISLAQSILKGCGQYGSTVLDRIARSDWHSIMGAKCPDPSTFSNAEDYAHAYLSYNLLRKYDSFPVDVDTAAVALGNFHKSEVKCGQFNRKGGALSYVPGLLLEHQQQSIVELAKGLIKRTLGKFDLSELEALCDFSNGASTGSGRKASHPIDKLSKKLHVTTNCRDLAVHYIWCNELWRKHYQNIYGRESDPYTWVQLVPGSRFTTVPKDSATDRPICIEPCLNMFFQKGIGAMIRRRLHRRGINLNDQSVNQMLALAGSIDDSLSTIDLSSASDSIALRIVQMLLPEDWFQYILITRSAYVLIDGKYLRLEKVSSMGNGFTFELESLIFWAISKACTIALESKDKRLSVYGDDIIVPAQVAGTLIGVLRSLGFETNINKTYIRGPFRESCGKHYFRGSDVSPFFIKEKCETHQDLYHISNAVTDWGWADDALVSSFIDKAIKPIPPSRRCYVPPSFSSRAGLRVTSPQRWCGKRQAYTFKYLREVRDEHVFNGPHAYLGAMLLSEQRSPDEYSITMKGNTRVVTARGYTSAWNDLPDAVLPKHR